jgi:hypothetical protein
MSWLRPVAKNAVKYGPHAQQVWKHAGKPAREAAQKAAADWSSRRTALEHADSVVDGSLLRVVHEGRGVWVVFSGDAAVASYPSVSTSPTELVTHADKGKRVTPEELRERQPSRRIRRRIAEQSGKLPGRPRRG